MREKMDYTEKQIIRLTSNLSKYNIEISDKNHISHLSHPDDPHGMNWAGESGRWGEVCLKPGVDLTVERQVLPSGRLQETYIFTNNTPYDIYTQKGEIGIHATFPDQYDSADICMTQRSHAHIWCGGEASYIMGLRMGGIAPHLGLVLTNGSITEYSIERDAAQSSNNRGLIILHPAPFVLIPGASISLTWELFWHEGKEDFYQQLQAYPRYIHVEADKYVLFAGEKCRLKISHAFPQLDLVDIICKGEEVPYSVTGNCIIVEAVYETSGEYSYSIDINGISTICNILVLPPLNQLIEARCHFIARKQQCRDKGSRLDGAFLVYDNEEQSRYYSHYHDHNGGRERFGMGVLIARYLQTTASDELEASLLKYVDYIESELFDEVSGTVFNDIGRNNDIHRLYNYSWLAILYMELFNLYKNKAYLVKMSKIMHGFYNNGGYKFYPIELPMNDMIGLLRGNELILEADSLYAHFSKHAETIFECGISYPPSEVNYEQSIVAPAANVLIQMYLLTKNEKYLTAFREHLHILELFNGRQPDYNLHEVAIRHWDGYWFGKRRLLGDTFPHYWSGLSGRVYLEYAKLTGEEQYETMGEASLRGVLSLFRADGQASCARLFPFKVNDKPGKYDDPWANDQDWALYFMIS
ncbi:hypothetical protein MHH49_17975 [Paenibacillus sp. FSL F4-0122]|uniref:hypothetical protein n=1 Tax=Paenibacillus sp. FSL F4-0122 TaxID=2921371 RepID=UPI000F9C24E0